MMHFYAVFALLLYLPARIRLFVLLTFFGASAALGSLARKWRSARFLTQTSPQLLAIATGVVIGHLWHQGRLRMPRTASILLILSDFFLLLDPMTDSAGAIKGLVGASAIVNGSLDARLAGLRLWPLHLLVDSSYSRYLSCMFTPGARCG